MKKSFYFIFSLSLISSLILVLSESFYLFTGIYCQKVGLTPFTGSFCSDILFHVFFFMVSLVTSLVLLYGEFYMEHYNFKKFFFLTLLFFGCMVILCSSSGLVNFMLGWDGLGISSLCLIMFYPNKTSFFNSFLTFFFNRLGDVFLLFLFSILISGGTYWFFLDDYFPAWVAGLVLLCASTKSAQFPLSSWLPAAMSAPTPISAMVHSSTLVTAGVFVLWKFYYYVEHLGGSGSMSILFLCTFLMGGSLACSEVDLKKIVAFSTMSQISMISFFLSLGMLGVCLFHMFIHALFKTMIFCCCGVMFLLNCGSQSSSSIKLTPGGKWVLGLLVCNVFCMTGFQFSGSFFTKDFILEYLLETKISAYFLLLLVGSVATILYSSLILKSGVISPFSIKNSYSFNKIHTWGTSLGMSLAGLLGGGLLLKIFPQSHLPIIGSGDVLVCSLILASPVLFNLSKKSLPPLSGGVELLYSKFFSFSIWKFNLFLDGYSMLMSDQIFFKSYVAGSSSLGGGIVKVSTLALSLFVFLWALM